MAFETIFIIHFCRGVFLEMKLDNIFSIIEVSFVLWLLILAWKLLNSYWLKPKMIEKSLRAMGFNGNSYRPLSGDTKDWWNMVLEAQSKPICFSNDIAKRVIPYYVETIKKYGENSFIWQGPTPTVFIKDPELLKEIFFKHNIFLKPDGHTKLLVTGLTSYEGEKWAKHRKIVTPAFHLEKLKLMLPAFNLSVSEMLSKWETIVSPKGSGELDIWLYIQKLTGDVISRTAFGSNYEEGMKIFELQKEMTEHYLMLTRMLSIPGARFLPTKRNRRVKYIQKKINESIRSIICKRLKEMKEGQANNNDDLLGILLECNEKEIQNHGDKKFGLTIKEVIDECRLFYFAGAETTAVLLVWTLILLGKHQEWQSRAREEVLNVFGRNQPNFEGLNQLKTMTMILNETLRLYPPAVALGRRIQEGTNIGTFSLTPEMTVTIPILLLHHDTKIWGDDAKEFKPERFAEGVSHATKGQPVFLPFAWGPRMCLGVNFSMVEAKLALARVLQNFSFELSPSYSHAPMTIVTLIPQHGAHLILHKFN